jgi:hypothetical protein
VRPASWEEGNSGLGCADAGPGLRSDPRGRTAAIDARKGGRQTAEGGEQVLDDGRFQDDDVGCPCPCVAEGTDTPPSLLANRLRARECRGPTAGRGQAWTRTRQPAQSLASAVGGGEVRPRSGVRGFARRRCLQILRRSRCCTTGRDGRKPPSGQDSRRRETLRSGPLKSPRPAPLTFACEREATRRGMNPAKGRAQGDRRSLASYAIIRLNGLRTPR